MKDLTHYFQCPAGGKEDKGQSGNGGVTVVNDNSDEDGPQKIHKSAYVVKNSSCHSSSNSESKNNPSHVRSSRRRIRSINETKTSNADNSTENVELDGLSTILQDEDMSIPQKTPIKASDRELHDETKFLRTAGVGKQKLKKKKKERLSLSSQKINNYDTDQSFSVNNELLNETFVESSKKTEDSALFQKNGKCSLFVRHKLKNGSKEIKDGFGTDVANETSTADKIPSVLNDRNNAFHILMSSRIWQSPHEHSLDETKDQTHSDRKKTRTVIGEASMKTAELREGRKKRKRKLEAMVEKRTKKATLNDTSSDTETEVDKKPVVRSRRIVIVAESDSDDNKNIALYQSTDTSKAKDDDKHVHRECGKMVVEETDDEYGEPNNEEELMKEHDKIVNQDSLMNRKLFTRRSMGKSTLSHKNSSKHILEGIKDDCSEPEQDCLQLKKPEEISSEKLIQISTRKCYEESEQEIRKGRRKLVMGGIRTETQGFEREDRLLDCQASVQETEILPSKLPKSTKKSAVQCNETPVRSLFERRAKLIRKCHKEHGKSGMKQSETQVEDDDSEEENQKQAEMNKKGKTKKASTVKTIDLKCDAPIEPKKHVPFSEDTKRTNSLFSYFNKVSKDEALQKPGKIQVKVQIHSPPVSPSMKKRSTNVPDDKRKRGNRPVLSKVLDTEDQIVVLESHTVNPASDGNAVAMITPKKGDEINGVKTPPSSSRWKMRVRLRELPAQPIPDDTGKKAKQT
jgi:hypothetical protein